MNIRTGQITIMVVALRMMLATISGSVALAQGVTAEIRTGCRQALNQRLFRDNRGSRIQTTLRNVRDRSLSNGQVSLTGEAEVSIDNGPLQTISFECTYNTRGDFAESASYSAGYSGNNSDRDNDRGFGGGGRNNQPGGPGWPGGPGGRTGSGRGINFEALPGFTMRRGGRGGNEIDLRLQVDGMIDVYIRGDQVRYEVINGQPPNDYGSEASVFLPRRELECQVEKRDGRAQILVIEQPTRFNNFTLHLQINDRDGGSDRYRARINW